MRIHIFYKDSKKKLSRSLFHLHIVIDEKFSSMHIIARYAHFCIFEYIISA